jgi:spermidine/putrescine transport system substrate-binding protein
VIWMDNMVILADSPNAYTAHVFMNFLMRPDIAARNAEYIGYLSPNVDGIKLLPQEIIDLYNEGFAPNDEVMKRLEYGSSQAQTPVPGNALSCEAPAYGDECSPVQPEL